MVNAKLRRTGCLAAYGITMVLVGALVAGGVAWAAQSPVDSSGVVHACYNPTTGALRLNTKGSCPAKGQSTPITWNATGPQGLQGPQGVQGPPGPAGTTGILGTGTNSAIRTTGTSQCSFVGQILLSAGPVAQGYPADGQYLGRTSEPALFQVIGTTFGDDPNGLGFLFRLPNLMSAAPNGLTYSICARGAVPTP